MAMEFITLRADSETVKMFDAEAKSLGMSRSELLRDLMIAVKDCRGILSARKMQKLPVFRNLEDKAAEWMLDNMPNDLTPDMLYVLGGIFHNLANDMMGTDKNDRTAESENIVKNVAKDLESNNE